jgi:molecular chaperone DnaK
VAAVFGAEKVKDHVDPMECVALGAAIHAATFPLGDSPAPPDARQTSRLIQRTPRALGISATKGTNPDAFVEIIPENTLYPLEEPKWKTFYPRENDQTLIKVPVYEGNHELASLNEQQGVVEFRLPEGISAATPVEVGLNYDANRTVTVEVRIVGSNLPPFRETVRRDRPVAPPGDTLKDDWREKLAPWIRAGQNFRDLYGSFMDRGEYEELCQALKDSDEALRAGNQNLGERALRVLHNRVLGSGVASQLFMAERAQNAPCATPEERETLGRAVARLRLAAKNGNKAEVDAIVKELRPKVSEVFSREDRGPRVADKQDDEGGLLFRSIDAGSGSHS